MPNRYCVIMCGGVGSRFWPFSRQEKPKQFLDFFGTGRTLLQMTVDRISPVVKPENIILLTNAGYAALIKEQLPEIPSANILCEPARRNTAPCLAWAARHIAAICPDALMAVLPADHLVLDEEEFRNCINSGFRFVEENEALLTLGIRPSSPNTGYGYIQKGQPVKGDSNYYTVKSFTEKPDLEMAEFFVQSGEFLWNSGIFLWSVRSILNGFDRHAPEISAVFDSVSECFATLNEQHTIDRVFADCPSISIDYAVMEKTENVYVLPVDFGWSDLGTWKALQETAQPDTNGNIAKNCRLLAENCSDNIFALTDNKVVVASGLNGYIVAENENALLIYPVSDEQKIRHIVNEVKNTFGPEYI